MSPSSTKKQNCSGPISADPISPFPRSRKLVKLLTQPTKAGRLPIETFPAWGAATLVCVVVLCVYG